MQVLHGPQPEVVFARGRLEARSLHSRSLLRRQIVLWGGRSAATTLPWLQQLHLADLELALPALKVHFRAHATQFRWAESVQQTVLVSVSSEGPPGLYQAKFRDVSGFVHALTTAPKEILKGLESEYASSKPEMS